MVKGEHVRHVHSEVESDGSRLLDLDGLAVQVVERDVFGGRVVRVGTADESASACPSCGVFSSMKGHATRPRDVRYGTAPLRSQTGSDPPGWTCPTTCPDSWLATRQTSSRPHTHGGVYTLNTKTHPGGSVWLGKQQVRVNGDRTDYLRNSRHEAQRAERLLWAAVGLPVPVRAALVFLTGSLIPDVTMKQQPDEARRSTTWRTGYSGT